MSITKSLIAACGLTLALAGAAAAQDTNAWDLKERMAIIVTPTGKTKLVKMNDTGHAMMMKEATALPAGAIILRSGGKLYVLQDKKMADGTMLFDRAGNWMAGGV